MWQDPIVKETRDLRKEYADKFNKGVTRIKTTRKPAQW
jgi:hypothetical protein